MVSIWMLRALHTLGNQRHKAYRPTRDPCPSGPASQVTAEWQTLVDERLGPPENLRRGSLSSRALASPREVSPGPSPWVSQVLHKYRGKAPTFAPFPQFSAVPPPPILWHHQGSQLFQGADPSCWGFSRASAVPQPQVSRRPRPLCTPKHSCILKPA